MPLKLEGPNQVRAFLVLCIFCRAPGEETLNMQLVKTVRSRTETK